MYDHSHKLFFLGVTGVMCAAALYAAQAVPEMFGDGQEARADVVAAAFDGQDQGLATAAFGAPQAVGNCTIAPISLIGAERDTPSRLAKPGPDGSCGKGLASGARKGNLITATAALPPS